MTDLQKINSELEHLLNTKDLDKTIEFISKLSNEDRLTKMFEIINQIEKYITHCNDPYNYSPREIKAIRDIQDMAPGNITFLLFILIKMIEKGVNTDDIFGGFDLDFA